MNEVDAIVHIPPVVKTIGGGAGYVIAAALFLRQWLSQAKVDRTANETNAATIKALREQVVAEQTRADVLMREREEMTRQIGELRGKVEAMSGQLESQSEQIRELMALVRSLQGEG